MKAPVTRWDYCQYRLVSPLNYTLTNVADHGEQFRHEALNRDRRGERITPRRVWKNGPDHGGATAQGDVVFEETGLDKHASARSEFVRRPSSGNAKAGSNGSGGGPCVYGPPGLDQFWLIDYRRYAPDGDGPRTLEHVRARLMPVVSQTQLPFHAGLMDPWSATTALRLGVESMQKRDYCPLKAPRRVAASGGQQPSPRGDELTWSAEERAQGPRLKLKGFPTAHPGSLGRVAGAPHRPAGVVTNDPPPESTEVTPPGWGFRWKLEPLPREGQQGPGLERCQGRTARPQRHPLGGALGGWVRLQALAMPTGRTIYQVKHGLLEDYLIQQLKTSTLKRVLAEVLTG